MDLNTLITMFITFTSEIIIAGVMLIKNRLNFRFKPYISIPVGLLIAYGSAFYVIFSLYLFAKPQDWTEFVNILAYTIPFAGAFFAFWFTYKIKPSQLILTLFVAYTFQHMAYQVSSLILDTGLSRNLFIELGQEQFNKVYPLISNLVNYSTKVIVLTLCYFFIARPYTKYSKYLLKTQYIVILVTLIYLVINVVNAYVVHRVWYDTTLRGILGATLIIFCLLFDVLVTSGFRMVERTEENIIIKTTLNSKIRQQEMMEKNINFINMKSHDLRKELRRLRDKNGALTDEDFALLEESINFYDSSVKTGNVNIDALIQDKLIYCNSVGIEFTSLVDGDAFKDISSSDVYFLLTNIIDNAIEATESIEEKEKRVITLTASKKQGVLVIKQSNYYKGQIIFNPDGSIKTTKEDKRYHGYGTKSIAYIVKKYDGKMQIDTKDNIFKLMIAI